MDDVDRALEKIQPLVPHLRQWTLDAMDDWHREHPVETRLRMSPLTRDNYLYDQIIGRAEVASSPVPIRVPKYGRMRWIMVNDGDIDIALWPKKVDFTTHLTSNYPTGTAVRRQQDWQLFGVPRLVLFVYGHTIQEDLAGSEAWIERVILTQENRDDEGVRKVIFRESIYQINAGDLPLRISDPQLALVPAEQLPRPVVKPRTGRKKQAPSSSPIVGIAEARRSAEAAAEKRSHVRKDGAAGA